VYSIVANLKKTTTTTTTKINMSNIQEEVSRRLNAGEKESDVRRFVRRELGLGKSQGNAKYNQMRAQILAPKIAGEVERKEVKVSSSSEKEKIKNLEFEKGYLFNREDRTYVVFLKSAARAIVVDEEMHNGMLRAYTSKEDISVEDICSSFSFPHTLFREYARQFGWIRTGTHLSDEVVENHTVEELVESVIQEKKWQVLQESKKRLWSSTENNSKKWMEFEEDCLKPFERVLDKWSPPEYTPVQKPKEVKENDSHVMLIGAADWHVGGIANPRYLYRSKEWNYEVLCEMAKQYGEKIRNEVNSRKYSINSAFLAIGGDICHTLTGYTDAGTKLEYEFIGEDQIDYAFSLMVSFINELLSTFETLNIKNCSGNHSFFGDYVLAKMLECYYRTENRIAFEITTKRYLPFKILNSLVILDHGASGKGLKSKLPRSGTGRESYVKGIFLENPELLIGVKSKIFYSQDKHHWEHIEYNDFDLIISPSIVRGDLFSDFSGFKSRPAQSVHVFNNDGIKELIRFYFD
jgi:hypothetical protein